MTKISDVLLALKNEYLWKEDSEISDFIIDSRCAIKGSLFVALPGQNVDGHDFVNDAFSKGSIVALIDKKISTNATIVDLQNANYQQFETLPTFPICFLVSDTLEALQKIASYWRNKFKVRVVGITGSVGKSSSKELIASVLSRRFITLKSQGNMNNEIGLPLSLLKLRPEHEIAVLEMGFYVPGEIKLLCNLAKPHVGIITNIGTVHAERAGDQKNIAKGKAELIESLPAAPSGLAILNYDDILVRDMAKNSKARIFYYGLTKESDLWADNIQSFGLEGIHCQLHYHGDVIHVKAPIIGRHSVYTLLRAASVALNEGMSWEWIVYALQASKVQLRLSTVKSTNGALLIDDTYNASPSSTLAALNLLSDLEGRKIAVLGDMLELGQYERHGHEMVGIRAAEVADEIVLIGIRSKITLEAVRQSGFNTQKLHWFEQPEEATEYLGNILQHGDVTLIKGSHSMQMDRIVSALEVKP